MDTCATAHEWVDKGIAVIPCKFRDKKPVVAWKIYQAKLPTHEEIDRWFSTLHNLAVVTGWKSLVVLDWDDLEMYKLWDSATKLETYRVRTARGIHVYIYLAEDPPVTRLRGLDIQSKGKYVVAPPSIHKSGVRYEVVDDSPIISITRLDEVYPKGLIGDRSPKGVTPKEINIPRRVNNNPYNAAMNPESLVQRIKRENPILSEFQDAVPSGGNGEWYLARCPLHDDHDPSMSINTHTGYCLCLAGWTERKRMDVINLISLRENLSNAEAIDYLRRRGHTPIPSPPLVVSDQR